MNQHYQISNSHNKMIEPMPKVVAFKKSFTFTTFYLSFLLSCLLLGTAHH
jgi:hypothetical protein